jgi:uncharacterized protein with von Willebrand factor type A (vWA) domain
MPRNRPDIEDGGSEDHDRREDEIRRVKEVFGPTGESGDVSTKFGGSPSADSLPTWNLDHDRYDERLYSELLAASSGLAELCSRDASPETFPELVADLFFAYFKAQPDLLPEDAVRPIFRRANRPFLERLLDDPDTYKARAATRLDAAASGLAALACGEKLIEEIQNRPALGEYLERSLREPSREMPGDDDEGGDVGEPVESGLGSDDEETSGSGGRINASGGDETVVNDESTPDENGDADAVEPQTGTDEDSDSDGAEPGSETPDADDRRFPSRDARRAVRSASRAAGEEARKIGEALSGWGLSPADLVRVPFGERLDLLKRLSGPEMLSLSEIVGRMRNLARRASREKMRDRSDEIHSIETSSDLSRLLPTELSALASEIPVIRLAAEARLIEGRSAAWRLAPRKKEERGSVVALVDVSLSMEGHPLQWATAVALGVVDLAAGRNGLPRRASAVLHFNTRVVSEVRFAPGERDAAKLLAVASVGASGGTAYEPAIVRAMEITSEFGFDGADILLITDQLCHVGEAFVESLIADKERSGVKLYSVLIGASSSGELERYSDRVWLLSELAVAGEEAAGELFGLF